MAIVAPGAEHIMSLDIPFGPNIPNFYFSVMRIAQNMVTVGYQRLDWFRNGDSVTELQEKPIKSLSLVECSCDKLTVYICNIL